MFVDIVAYKVYSVCHLLYFILEQQRQAFMKIISDFGDACQEHQIFWDYWLEKL